MCEALMELINDTVEEKVAQKLAEKELAEETLLQLIRKKLAKGKSPQEIANDLEEGVDTIHSLIQKIN